MLTIIATYLVTTYALNMILLAGLIVLEKNSPSSKRWRVLPMWLFSFVTVYISAGWIFVHYGRGISNKINDAIYNRFA